MNIVFAVTSLAQEGQELFQALSGPVEVELYQRYLDLWWEWQFIMHPSLLEPVIGC